MKKVPYPVILVLLATACAAQQKTPDSQGQTACVINVSKSEPRICTMHYDPVCGCNGKTYGNACTATGAGVQQFQSGSCEDARLTPD